MNSLHSQQMWDLMRERQNELLRQAQREHLAREAQQHQEGWLKNLFRRQAQTPAITLNPSATPELG